MVKHFKLEECPICHAFDVEGDFYLVSIGSYYEQSEYEEACLACVARINGEDDNDEQYDAWKDEQVRK